MLNVFEAPFPTGKQRRRSALVEVDKYRFCMAYLKAQPNQHAVPEIVEEAMFADDVSLFSSQPNRKVAEASHAEGCNEGNELEPLPQTDPQHQQLRGCLLYKQLEGGLMTTLATTKRVPSSQNLLAEVTHDRALYLRPYLTACVS